MKLILHEISVPLRHPFTTAHGTLREKRNVLVELQADGLSGWGEAAPSLAYPKNSVEEIQRILAEHRSSIEAATWENPAELWASLDHVLSANRFSQCALDVAAHDLWGKRHGRAVWEMWGLNMQDVPMSNYTIGLDSIEIMVQKLKEFSDWPIFKIKLGTDHDVEIIRELRTHTRSVFRVDANTGWSVDQALEAAPIFAELGVEFIEQPLPVANWKEMEHLRRHCPLPLIADESCQEEEDVRRCCGAFHGVNVKLSKAGGLTPAKRMLEEARRLGMKTMAGCMVETSVGISAQAQLIPLLDMVDMDGALLLAADPADGVRVERGRVMLTDTAGTGVNAVRLS